jgi:hypothetical protein
MAKLIHFLVEHAKSAGRWSLRRDNEMIAARITADPTKRLIHIQKAREYNHDLLWNLRQMRNIRQALPKEVQP